MKVVQGVILGLVLAAVLIVSVGLMWWWTGDTSGDSSCGGAAGRCGGAGHIVVDNDYEPATDPAFWSSP